MALAEGAELPGEQVEFVAEAAFHQNLRLAGSRVSDGDPLLASGTVLGSREIGLLAEVGLDKVLARPRPRVVILTIGNDLIAPGLPLTRLTHAYDATTSLIAASARADVPRCSRSASSRTTPRPCGVRWGSSSSAPTYR